MGVPHVRETKKKGKKIMVRVWPVADGLDWLGRTGPFGPFLLSSLFFLSFFFILFCFHVSFITFA
jgi:hypothetical protein